MHFLAIPSCQSCVNGVFGRQKGFKKLQLPSSHFPARANASFVVVPHLFGWVLQGWLIYQILARSHSSFERLYGSTTLLRNIVPCCVDVNFAVRMTLVGFEKRSVIITTCRFFERVLATVPRFGGLHSKVVQLLEKGRSFVCDPSGSHPGCLSESPSKFYIRRFQDTARRRGVLWCLMSIVLWNFQFGWAIVRNIIFEHTMWVGCIFSTQSIGACHNKTLSQS